MNDALYKKQFGFQKAHPTEHAIIQLTDQINSSFEKTHFTSGLFIIKSEFPNYKTVGSMEAICVNMKAI